MGRQKRIIVLIFMGALCWVFASLMGWTGGTPKPKKLPPKATQEVQVVQLSTAEVVPKIILEKVVCTKTPVKRGDKLDKDLVELKEFDVKDIEKDTCKTLDEVIGMVAVVDIESSQQLKKEQFVDLRNLTKMSLRIPKGMRAISLKVGNPYYVISGLITQLDRVDVIAVFKSPSEVDDGYSKIVVEDAILLALGETYDPDQSEFGSKAPLSGTPGAPGTTAAPGQPAPAPAPAAGGNPAQNLRLMEGKKMSNVTLAVLPKDAEALAMITEKADFFYLALRYPFDDEKIGSTGTVQHEVLGVQKRDEIVKIYEHQAKLKELQLQKVMILKGSTGVDKSKNQTVIHVGD
ncbi:MAG: Flp pilus assembly protein CpaB [Candidatus Wallbacteria bacterium]|nr:Flp pilus assembly protein CpaB [Candidatus Wallbacteria bacterium]